MKIVLFEDNCCTHLRPLGLFRPLFDLYVGTWTLFRVMSLTGFPVRALIRDHFLIGDEEHPRLKSPLDEPHLFVNASVEPAVGYAEILRDLAKAGDPCIMKSGDRIAAAFVPTGTAIPESASSDEIDDVLGGLNLPEESNRMSTMDWPHEAVGSHPRLFAANLEKRIATGKFNEEHSGVFLGNGASLHPSTVLDTDNGPIVIGAGAVIEPFVYLQGPVYVGRNVRVLDHSALRSMMSVERGCLVGGEMGSSEIEPHSSITRSTFGHSHIGRWVSIGAGTVMSDAKSTFGKVRIAHQGKRIATDMENLGAVIGDFASLSINTAVFTGKTIGVCSTAYGMVATSVASFTNYARSFGQVTEINPEQALVTQQRLFERYDKKQSKRDIGLIKRAFAVTQDERKLRDKQITF
ncbi:putative sugar nucleotidyl transferase [Candidatus Latescibacterota bacterium]